MAGEKGEFLVQNHFFCKKNRRLTLFDSKSSYLSSRGTIFKFPIIGEFVKFD